MPMDFVKINSNGLATTAGTPHGSFQTARSCVDNAVSLAHLKSYKKSCPTINITFIFFIIGGSDADAGGSCEDGPDPENWCHDVNSWACTNPNYQDYFTTNCQKLCGSC